MSSSTISGPQRVALGLPAVLLLLPFLAAIVLMLRFSLSADGQQVQGWSLAHYAGLLEPSFLAVCWTTFKLAAVSALICLVLAVPMALLLGSVQNALWRRVLMCLVLLPLIVNLLIQSYGWMLLLGSAGLLNRLLALLGAESPVMLLFTEWGVLAGLVQTALPFAVFAIMASMRAIRPEYLEAAASLGATAWRGFRDVTLPLLRPGLVSAASVVFAFNASAFAVPLLLGGRKVQTVGTVIRDLVSTLFDWAGAAASGMVLIVATALIMALGAWLSAAPPAPADRQGLP